MDLISQYLDYVAPLKGSLAYHRWSILSVVSALLERRVWIDRGRLGILFPNTYTILVGPPATGKSTAAGLAVDLFAQVKPPGRKPPHLGPTKITQAALYEELRDSERSFQCAGQGLLKSSPLFIYASELAINMTDFGGGTLTNELIDFYDSKGLEVTLHKRTIKGGLLKLYNPSVTLLGCTTDGFLQNAAQQKLITSGLSSRILFVVETEKVAKERGDVIADARLKQILVDRLEDLYRFQGPMTIGADAKSAFIEIANAADEACYAIKSEFHQNYFGRKPDHILKVAACFAAVRRSREINNVDLFRAKDWIEELEPTMIKAFGTRSIVKDPDFAMQLEDFIPNEPQTISKAALLRTLMSYGKFVALNGDYTAAIEGLLGAQLVTRTFIGDEQYFSRLIAKPK